MKKKMIPADKRPATPITMRMPVDVVEDLKRMARLKGMSGYQALIKFYVGQGLRKDLAELEANTITQRMGEILLKYNIDSTVVEKVLKTIQKDTQSITSAL